MKKKIFGIPALALVLGLLVVGGATAVLVDYLSNTVSSNVEVESPIDVWFESEETDTGTGHSVTLDVKSRNNADMSIYTYPVYLVEGPGVWDGTEIESVSFKDKNHEGDIIDNLYHVRNDGNLVKYTELTEPYPTTLKLFFDNTIVDIDEGYEQPSNVEKSNVLKIQFNSAVEPGDYSFKHCHLYELTGNCVLEE